MVSLSRKYMSLGIVIDPVAVEMFTGDVVYLNVFGRPVVILNSPKAAADLLDRRAANYSNRPRNIVGSEMMTGGMFMVLNSCGEL